LRVRQLHILPRYIDLGYTPHLEKRLNLLQVLALIFHRCLSHLHQLLRGQHAEISIAHVQQSFLLYAVTVLLRLRQFCFSALDRPAGQPEVVDILAEV
jgi:hypothetical protein